MAASAHETLKDIIRTRKPRTILDFDDERASKSLMIDEDDDSKGNAGSDSDENANKLRKSTGDDSDDKSEYDETIKTSVRSGTRRQSSKSSSTDEDEYEQEEKEDEDESDMYEIDRCHP